MAGACFLAATVVMSVVGKGQGKGQAKQALRERYVNPIFFQFRLLAVSMQSESDSDDRDRRGKGMHATSLIGGRLPKAAGRGQAGNVERASVSVHSRCALARIIHELRRVSRNLCVRRHEPHRPMILSKSAQTAPLPPWPRGVVCGSRTL